ncbi:diguanylate cyclase, partial [Klebsiella pneumoniae]|nr:diguanylate cyclase [Klebsiella pneumoniae]
LTQLATKSEADDVLERVAGALAKPIALRNGKSAHVGITFGMAYGEEHLDAATLIARADARMYAHKPRGRTEASPAS